MINEDLNIFLTDFALPAVLTVGTTSKSIPILFDEEYVGMELGAEGRSLTATCKSSDVLGANHRSQLQIAGKVYRIEGVRPIMDGQFTELVLKA